MHPKEIGYFVAPTQARAENVEQASDFAMSQPAFVPERHEVWFTDGTSGFYALKVADGVWPDDRRHDDHLAVDGRHPALHGPPALHRARAPAARREGARRPRDARRQAHHRAHAGRPDPGDPRGPARDDPAHGDAEGPRAAAQRPYRDDPAGLSPLHAPGLTARLGSRRCDVLARVRRRQRLRRRAGDPSSDCGPQLLMVEAWAAEQGVGVIDLGTSAVPNGLGPECELVIAWAATARSCAALSWRCDNGSPSSASTSARRVPGRQPPGQLPWGADVPNLRAALTWALETDQIEFSLDLLVALEQLSVLGYTSEGMRWFSAFLEQADNAPPLLRARALRWFGSSAHFAGEFELAERLCNASLAEYERLEDDHGIAVLLHRLSIFALMRGELERARALAGRSLELHRLQANDKGAVQPLALLGAIELQAGDRARDWRCSRRAPNWQDESGGVGGGQER